MSNYTPILELKDVETFENVNSEVSGTADQRDGKVYYYAEKTKLAVNVALAVNRPLLVLGKPGTGKSSIAHNLARVMKRRYYEYIVTSTSDHRDLLYEYDTVKRLTDALTYGSQGEGSKNLEHYPYINPGPIWWILNPETARLRGAPKTYDEVNQDFSNANDLTLSKETEPLKGAVFLVDEIDKAGPDFANNLLVPFGSYQFPVKEIGEMIKAPDSWETSDYPFMIFSSNEEKELPPAFIRRCVVLRMEYLSAKELAGIAQKTKSTYRFGKMGDAEKFAEDIKHSAPNQEISTAEYIDLLKAMERLDIKHTSTMVEQLVQNISWRSIR